MAGSGSWKSTGGRIILVAVDGSEGSEEAFRSMLKIVHKASDHIILLHVKPPGPPLAQCLLSSAHDSLPDEDEPGHASGILRKFSSMARNAMIEFETIEVEGDPRERITTLCDEMSATLLVIGSRGLGYVNGMFLGSVSNYCAHNAPCPVMIARNIQDPFCRVIPGSESAYLYS